MLENARAQATIPAEDLQRAVRFYRDTLGLKTLNVNDDQAAVFEAGHGSQILIYHRSRTKAEHTAITFQDDDLEKILKDLGAKGVKPEHYDMEHLKTDARGIASMGGHQMAWITDPEGNILGFFART